MREEKNGVGKIGVDVVERCHDACETALFGTDSGVDAQLTFNVTVFTNYNIVINVTLSGSKVKRPETFSHSSVRMRMELCCII